MNNDEGFQAQELEVPLIKVKRLAEILGVSIATVHRCVAEGKIPAPLNFSRTLVWRLSDINQWLRSAPTDRGKYKHQTKAKG
jgi:predicted DNA-binding transcriptional regulator AlpA